MSDEYKSDKALCAWLRENSSGNYMLADYAADRIEDLGAQLSSVQYECEKLETIQKAAPDMLEALEYFLDSLGDEHTVPSECIGKMIKAIEKAKGE